MPVLLAVSAKKTLPPSPAQTAEKVVEMSRTITIKKSAKYLEKMPFLLQNVRTSESIAAIRRFSDSLDGGHLVLTSF